MLYSIFIYQTESGLLLWDKSFEKDMDSNKIQLFSSFFSAIQSFVKEIISTGSKGLKNIEMGNFLVNVTAISKLGLDIVAIADKGDEKHLHKFTPKLIKILSSHSEIFKDWDGNRGRFKILDLEILQILKNEKNLVGNKSLLDERSQIIGDIFNNLPDLETEQKSRYIKEREFLEKRLRDTPSIPKKLEVLNSIEEINRKLKDTDAVQKSERNRKKLLTELRSTKDKLRYFLSNTKNAINKTVDRVGGRNLFDLDFKDAYLNLYSFSTKLKMIGRADMSEEYRGIARMFIDKPEEMRGEFSQLVTKVINLSDDIDSYFQ